VQQTFIIIPGGGRIGGIFSVVKNGDGLKMQRERERRKRYIVWQYSKVVVEERKRKKRGERRRKYQNHLDWLAAMGHRVSSRLGWLKIGIENQVVVVVVVVT
jgi:hypothetical protein